MSSTAHLDQDALANLTPEEREAFNESEYSDSEKESLARLAAKAAGDDTDDDADDGDPDEVLDADGKPVTVPGATDKSGAGDKPAAPVSEDGAPTNVAAPEPAPEKQVVYKATLPEDFENKVKDLGERAAALKAQFKAGEIDFDTFEEQNGALLQERETLTLARAKAEISQEMIQQQAETTWANAINKLFTSASKNDGIDYKGDKERNAELDQFVKVLANKPENQDKSMDWFLNEAHKRVLVLNGKTIQAPTEQTNKETKPNAQNRTPPNAPKHIAQVPGGDGPGDVGGEFQHLDALDGNDLEAAIAKMTPAQREKFSRGG